MNKDQLLKLPGMGFKEIDFLMQSTSGLNDEQKQQFFFEYLKERKSPNDFLILTLLGILAPGIDRFVAGEILWGVIYFLTAGFCRIGSIVDIVIYKSIALTHNRKVASQSIKLIAPNAISQIKLKGRNTVLNQKYVGVAFLIIGIIFIIFSRSMSFTNSQSNDLYDTNRNLGLPDAYNNHVIYNTIIEDPAINRSLMTAGILLLLGGGICFLISLKDKDTLSPPQAVKTPPTIVPVKNEILNQIEQLNNLRTQGALSDEEFSSKKNELLKRL